MKVLFLSRYPTSSEVFDGGVAGACYSLATEVAARPGMTADVLDPFSQCDTPSTRRIDGVEVIAWPIWNGSRLSRLNYVRLSHDIARFVKDRGYDLVHVQGEPTLSRMIGTKSLLTIHGIQERDALFLKPGWRGWVRSRLLRFREQHYRRKFTDIILINPYVARFVAKHPKLRTWQIDNPVRPSFFDVVRNPVNARIFFGGRITPLKNVHGIIGAFASAVKEHPSAELRIAGPEVSPEYARVCRQLAKSLGVADRVSFLGSLPVSRVREELSRAWFVVVCSFQEVAPLVIAEAMAAGVPVLASRIGGIPFMIEDGKTGILVDAKRTQDIASGMKTLLASFDLAPMGIACKQAAESRYRTSSVADRTIAAYSEVLGA